VYNGLMKNIYILNLLKGLQ